MKPVTLDISKYDYDLPEERIAKFPLPQRESSRLLVWRDGLISEDVFSSLADVLPGNSLLVFNNSRVIRARILMRKKTGALIEIFCLEPYEPGDYERSLASTSRCEWKCITGNSKKWKRDALELQFPYRGNSYTLTAERGDTNEQTVVFQWDAPVTFGQLLEILGRIPIPPYLGRDSEEIDNTRYQTVYSRLEGSVAAPTAGLHFSNDLIEKLKGSGTSFAEVTLHVGAGTFLPVKSEDASQHEMHTEHFSVTRKTLQTLINRSQKRIAVGTTTVRTLESMAVLGYRITHNGSIGEGTPIGQWEAYSIPDELSGRELLGALLGYMEKENTDEIHASTKIMIAPGFRFRVTDGIITNFHQPKSTLLLLVSAFTGTRWKEIYSYALSHDFRFLSYGDSSILLK